MNAATMQYGPVPGGPGDYPVSVPAGRLTEVLEPALLAEACATAGLPA